jgi:hypothetical protein
LRYPLQDLELRLPALISFLVLLLFFPIRIPAIALLKACTFLPISINPRQTKCLRPSQYPESYPQPSEP